MSIDMMRLVFGCYPSGGGERLLALALADHAHDDGTNIYPSVRLLAEKTCQSERTVQYQLRKMEDRGWLIRVSEGRGSGITSEYLIDPDWIMDSDTELAERKKVQMAAQRENKKGAIHDKKGAIHDKKGAIAVAPESSITIIQPSEAAQQVAQPIAKQVSKIGWDVPDKMFKGITPERMKAWEHAFPGFDVEGELTRIDLWYERRLRESPKFRWKNAERGIHNWLSRAYTDSKKPKVFVKQQAPATQPTR